MVPFVCPEIYGHAIRIMVSSKTRSLLRIARRGPLRARDLEQPRIPRTYLRRLAEQGVLERVDRGLYRLANAPVTELNSVAHAAKRAPSAIVCLLSALQIHHLTAEVPHAVWVMIDRHARTPRSTFPKLAIVRASGRARTHGTEQRTIEGVRVRLTTPAKTVADCFRYRRHVGLDVALAALRDYLRRHRGGIDSLVAAARADRIYPFMRPYLEALA
jgi:predicted transcriptional regulator of viral defense system